MSITEFLTSRPFEPDPFQWEAAEALERGSSVVVTAPTGAGKTLVADTAIHLALERDRRVFYTTPIKALSNQKFGDLCAELGAEQVGLLTGDNVINGGARVVVMTTEVLRNMIYADREVLDDVGFVVLDEVHYLQDPFRGAVWEEVIIHASRHLQFVCLSATIANAEEFAGWIGERRGRTELIRTDHRPVPLEPMYLMADRMGDEGLRLFEMFTVRDGRSRPNPKLQQLLSRESGRRRRFATPGKTSVVEHLQGLDMLPAIVFVFSRAGCDAAALRILESGLQLVDPAQRDRIRAIAEERTEHLSDGDLSALDYGRWLAGLERGVAAHHAGMVPAFKETVEELFAAGLIGAVFATETLALGINMPARTVVLDSLSKYTGEGHALIEPGDFTQLTGRAGRRGIDTRGYGVVLHSRFVSFEQVVKIAEVGSHPLRSSFRPNYNMAANLVANYEQPEAESLLEASFAQYQRSTTRAAGAEAIARLEARLTDDRSLAECDLGSIDEYLNQLDGARPGRNAFAGALRPGDVVDIPDGSRSGRYLIVRRVARGGKGVRFLVLGTSGRISTIGSRDMGSSPSTVGTLEMTTPYRGGNDRKFIQQMLRALRRLPEQRVVQPTVSETIDHPVAACPHVASHVRHARAARRSERRLEQHRRDARLSGEGLVEDFRSIQAILADWDYLTDWCLTPRGQRLRFVYNELALLLTEVIERGLLRDLDPASLAAVLTCFVFEPRTDEREEPRWPGTDVEDEYRAIVHIWEELVAAERRHRLVQTRPPEPGLVAVMYRWASGVELEDIDVGPLAAGDFVRVSRQLVDLLRQVRDAFPDLADTARDALHLIDRGVVAAQGVG